MQIVTKSLRGLNKGHLRFHDFQKVEIIEKAVVRAHNFDFNLNSI